MQELIEAQGYESVKFEDVEVRESRSLVNISLLIIIIAWNIWHGQSSMPWFHYITRFDQKVHHFILYYLSLLLL